MANTRNTYFVRNMFYFLSTAMKYLPLNISYAIWAGLGLVLTTLVSVIIFKENINLISIFSIT